MTRRRDEDGSALIEVTWLGILLMVPLVYIVLSVFEVQRGAFAVSAGSRAAARAYALAPDQASGEARAKAAVQLAMRDQGIGDEAIKVNVTCTPDPKNCLQGESIIIVDVWTQVDLPLMPSMLGGDTPSFRLESHHRVPYGTFRENRSGDS